MSSKPLPIPNEDCPTDYDDGTIPPQYKNVVEDPEDNDGEVKGLKDEEKSDPFMTTISIVKNILGSGILNFPVIIRTLGIVPGCVVICLLGVVAFLTSDYLLQCKTITRKYGYSMYGKMTMGKYGTIFLKISLIISNFGTCCFYLKILGELIASILSIFIDLSGGEFYTTPVFFMIVSFLLLLPLIYFDGIQSLNKANFLGVVSIIIFFFSIVILFIYKLIHHEMKAVLNSELLFPHGTFFEMFACYTAIIDSYTYKHNYFPIYLSSKPRNNKTMNKATAIAVTFCCLFFCLVGVLCFLMFGYNFKDIISALNTEILLYLNKNNYIVTLIVIVEASYVISSLLTLPLLFFSVKKNIINLIIFIYTKMFEKKKDEALQGTELEDKTKEEALTQSTHHTKTAEEVFHPFIKHLIVTLSYIMILVCTLFVESIINISNAMGSTTSNLVMIIFPSFFLVKLDLSNRWHVVPRMLCVIGVLTIGYYIYSETYKMIYHI